MTLYRWLFTLALVLVLSGCVPYPLQPPQSPGTNPAASGGQWSAANTGTLDALEQLTILKEELKKLRNAVEEIQFTTENATRRQHNLFQDMDRRLLGLERAQRMLSLPSSAPADGSVGALPGTFPDALPGTLPGVTPGGVDGAIDGVTDITGVSGITGTADVAIVAGSTAATETPIPALPGGAEEQIETVSVPEQEAYNKAYDLLTKSKYQDAINQFRQMAETWPDSQLADDAYYWMSEALYVNREFEAALSGFRTVVTRYPDSQRVPEALLKIGTIRYDIGAYTEAAEIFRDILTRFPGHQVSVSAQTRLRRIEQTIQ